MDDYDKNHWWAEKFIEKFTSRNKNKYPVLEHVLIRFSPYDKGFNKKMIMFSFQNNQSSITETTATSLEMNDYHDIFKQNFQTCFNMYFAIGKSYK